MYWFGRSDTGRFDWLQLHLLLVRHLHFACFDFRPILVKVIKVMPCTRRVPAVVPAELRFYPAHYVYIYTGTGTELQFYPAHVWVLAIPVMARYRYRYGYRYGYATGKFTGTAYSVPSPTYSYGTRIYRHCNSYTETQPLLVLYVQYLYGVSVFRNTHTCAV